MSSLSRRACYKCGDLGHHAEACSSPHRLCYNCKQPSEFSHRHAGPRVPKTNHTAVQTTSRASALSRARPRRSSATTARDSATSKPIAPLCALAVPVRRAVATTASSLATTLYISHPPPLLMSALVLTWTSVPALPRSTRVRFGVLLRFRVVGSSLASAAAATLSASALRRATSAEARTTLPATARRRP